MSTELKTLKGKIEIPNFKSQKSEYKNVDVQLNSFYGGKERGKSLQITFENESDGYSHIQLSNSEVLLLMKELEEVFK